MLSTLNTMTIKAKINDRGIAAVAYNVLLRPGVTLGLGASFNTQKLDHAAHKVGIAELFVLNTLALLIVDRLVQALPSMHKLCLKSENRLRKETLVKKIRRMVIR